MNVKEITKELIEDYTKILKPHVMISDGLVRKCVIATANKMQKLEATILGYNPDTYTSEFWEEVKQEINKL